jgi:ketosteroid isomerase-like protein
MSRENVELTRQYVEAFNAGGLDGTQHLRHPQIEVHDPPDLPDADQHVGEAAARERVESYLELGWDGHFHVREYIDGGEEVIVIWQLAGQAALGGVPIDVPAFAHVYAFEDGKVRRIRQYFTRAEALDAAGLSE